MKHKVRLVFETIIDAKSKREAKKMARQMLRGGRIGEPKIECTNIEDDDDLSIVAIGNFCLLADKYKGYLKENGQKVPDDEETRKGVSESITSLLEIMDSCQKALYLTEYSEENIEHMKKFKEMYEEGLRTLEEVSKGFEIATCKRGKNDDGKTEK